MHVTRFLICAALLTVAIPSQSAERWILQHGPSPDGRDTVRVLGNGEQVLFTSDGKRLLHAEAVDAAAPVRFLIQLHDPGTARSFADGVRARQSRAASFERTLASAMPERFARAGAVGVRVTHVYDRLVAAVLVEAPAELAAKLGTLDGVERVTRDAPVRSSLFQSVPQIHADRVQRELGARGTGVRVGVIDTGIDYLHPALGGGYGPGWRVAGGWNFIQPDSTPLDDHGHGTHVAGIIGADGGGSLGIAPGVTFYAYKVLDSRGSGYLSTVVEALERCADPDQDPSTADALDVVNLSLGGDGDEDDVASRAVDALDALGTVVVAAAGNDYRLYGIGSPGVARRAVTVGSVDKRDTLSAFSSRGPTPELGLKPDLVAPGEDILSLAPGGGSRVLSGTSMATPHVAGVAALLRQLHPEWDAAELRSALIGGAVPVDRTVFEQGAGRVDAWASATATLFTSPTRLEFGRARPGGGDVVAAETLRVHTSAPGGSRVQLRWRGDAPATDASVSIVPTELSLLPGRESIAVVTIQMSAGRARNVIAPFACSGAVELVLGAEVRRVPCAMLDCLRFEAYANGVRPSGLLSDERRLYSPASFSKPVWYLPDGVYDYVGFGNSSSPEPFQARDAISVTTDTLVDVANPQGLVAVRFDLQDERGRPIEPQRRELKLVHRLGYSIGQVGFSFQPQLLLPVGSSNLRLEWSAYDADGPVRYDIPGTLEGPFRPTSLGSAPGSLRRRVEHVAVAPGDSVLVLEFRLHPSGEEGWFGFAGLDPFSTPFGAPFDVVRWTGPTPTRRHFRFGRLTYLEDAAATRAGIPFADRAMSAVWLLDRGDTTALYTRGDGGLSWYESTGRDLPFGSGPGVLGASVVMSPDQLDLLPPLYGQRPFMDVVHSVTLGPASEYVISYGGVAVEHGVLSDSQQLFGFSGWSYRFPGQGTYDVLVRSRGWSVAGTPSTTSIQIRRVSSIESWQVVPPVLFAVFADGGPAERIAFGLARDPHVSIAFQDASFPVPHLACRVIGSSQWLELPLTRSGLRLRAPLPPLDGPVELRLSLGDKGGGVPALEIVTTPAFVGATASPSAAPLLRTSADASGARVEWNVGQPQAQVGVERRTATTEWILLLETEADLEGVVRFDDVAVTPGTSYAYRLAGTDASVWVRVPLPGAALALSVSPDPTPRDILAAVTLDHASPFTLTLHDLQGRVVSQHHFAALPAGVHVVAMTRGQQPRPGLYFVRLVRGSESVTRRVTVLP